MVAEPSRPAHRIGMLCVGLLLTWAGVACWNFVKPMPPGTRVSSLSARVAESSVDWLDEALQPGVAVRRAVALIERAEQMIVIDQCPLPRELVAHLLARKRQRPNLKIVLVTDPRAEVVGGTPALTLSSLEAAGVIVARTNLDRLRDSNPLYSSLWRLGAGWWSDPFDAAPGRATVMGALRQWNDKANERRVLVADDGSGGWSSMVASGGGVALEIRGHLARDIAASELQIATWSTEDDRLPPPPPAENRSLGVIDARLLTEGGVMNALRDAISMAVGGDTIDLAVPTLADRQIVQALLRATARGAHLRLLLDPSVRTNTSVAAEMLGKAGAAIDVRWKSRPPGLLLVRHRMDVWLNVGSADFTRRDLDDLNLEAHVELHMPARAAPARAAVESFTRAWSGADTYARHVDASNDSYWRYRIAEATGLPVF